jgi:hypothetical protein
MTQSPGLLILALLAAGALFVLLPVTLLTFYESRRKKSVTCPETGCGAEIELDAARAARSAAFGRVSLRVACCSLWPGRAGCDQACLRAAEPVGFTA